ncbi:MAG TPA: DNA helicase [Firmicutes bacterium]|nr:DNA helicase [Bacillota bacterium]
MDFRIADTFTDSLARLTGEEQKVVKTTAFDLQLDPASPGMQFHRLERAKDRRFWSVRASEDIRLIVHRTDRSLLLCYVDHHDAAYSWAERRRLSVHPKTGAAQLVEIRETAREITVPQHVEVPLATVSKPRLFADFSDDDLLSYGVPNEWLGEVREVNEDSLLELALHLPSEAAEALLSLAVGETPEVAPAIAADEDPFDHPDAQRRFRVMNNVEELERALEYPWDKWAVFLHPAQRELVERSFNGPARVSGSAGTGKTVVALHRAVYLARSNPDARVLLTTFSDTLAHALKAKLVSLISNEPHLGERLEVHSMQAIGLRLYELNFDRPNIVSAEIIEQLLLDAARETEVERFSRRFLLSEWLDVVDAWQLGTWQEYRDVLRLGRKTRLPEKQRAALWAVFDRVQAGMKNRNLITYSQLFSQLASQFAGRPSPFEFVVVDEAQDVSVAQLRFLAALGTGRPNSLFFAGDLGQRIFQQPFSWKALGVDVRGRSRTLRINYRTSHQIRSQADRLLDPELTDVDGNSEQRRGTISVFNGPVPVIRVRGSQDEETNTVSQWLAERLGEGMAPHEIGVFVRSAAEIERARAAVERAGIPFKVLDERVGTPSGHASISTMHLAKGLEFRAVAVMACDDEVVPLQERIKAIGDETDLEEVYNTERQLLYVACTRARDNLLVTGVKPGSEFLEDLSPGSTDWEVEGHT